MTAYFAGQEINSGTMGLYSTYVPFSESLGTRLAVELLLVGCSNLENRRSALTCGHGPRDMGNVETTQIVGIIPPIAPW
jgi:hypothetical protein